MSKPLPNLIALTVERRDSATTWQIGVDLRMPDGSKHFIASAPLRAGCSTDAIASALDDLQRRVRACEQVRAHRILTDLAHPLEP